MADSTSDSDTFRIKTPDTQPYFGYAFTVDGTVIRHSHLELHDEIHHNDDGTVTVEGTVGNGHVDGYKVDGTITGWTAPTTATYTLTRGGDSWTAPASGDSGADTDSDDIVDGYGHYHDVDTGDLQEHVVDLQERVSALEAASRDQDSRITTLKERLNTTIERLVNALQ